jgi:hypothetical protein
MQINFNALSSLIQENEANFGGIIYGFATTEDLKSYSPSVKEVFSLANNYNSDPIQDHFYVQKYLASAFSENGWISSVQRDELIRKSSEVKHG